MSGRPAVDGGAGFGRALLPASRLVALGARRRSTAAHALARRATRLVAGGFARSSRTCTLGFGLRHLQDARAKMPGVTSDSGLTMTCGLRHRALDRKRDAEDAFAFAARDDLPEQRNIAERAVEPLQAECRCRRY